MARKHIFVVDGNSIAHANHNGMTLTVGETQVQAIFGVLKTLRATLRDDPGSEIIVLWDGRAQFRVNLFAEYKGNRAEMDDKQLAHKQAFRAQMPILEKALSLLGVRQFRSPLLEADDLAGIVIPQLLAVGYRVTMLSGDRDWLQQVGAFCMWKDPIKNRSVGTANFLEFTGYFTTDAFVQGKALQGDSSDNINGIAGMGEKTAALFLAKWKDVREFFKAVDSGSYAPAKRASKKSTSLHPEQILASPEGRALFERNMKLMDWKLSRRPEAGEIIKAPTCANAAGFERLCQALAFQSILRELPAFLSAFNISSPAKA